MHCTRAQTPGQRPIRSHGASPHTRSMGTPIVSTRDRGRGPLVVRILLLSVSRGPCLSRARSCLGSFCGVSSHDSIPRRAPGSFLLHRGSRIRRMPDHSDVSPYFRSMGPLELLWYFVWRMVAWVISCGVILGLPIALLTEIPFYAVGDAEEVVDALAPGALLGGFLGALPGDFCGLGLAVLTLASRRPPQRIRGTG